MSVLAPSSTARARAPQDTAATVVRSVALYPVLWVLGLGGLYWPLLALVTCWSLGRRRWSVPVGALVMLSLAVVASIPLGLLRFGVEPSRAASVLANVSVWIALAAALHARWRAEQVTRLAAALVAVAVAQGGLVALALLVAPAVLPLPLGSGLAGALPGGAAVFAEQRLLYTDWLDGAALRSVGLMGNPTWAGAFGVAAMLVALSLRSTGSRGRMLCLLGVASGVLSLGLSLSRWTVASLLVGLVLGVVVRGSVRLRVHPVAVLLPVLFLLTAGVLSQWTRVVDALVAVNSARAGSIGTRAEVYQRTWDHVVALRLPLFGYGIKPREEGLEVGIATHSAYLGLIFRGGLVALACLVVVLTLLLWWQVRIRSAAGVAVVVFVALWLVLEDLDAGHLLPLVLVHAHATAVSLRGHEPNPGAATASRGPRSPEWTSL